MTLPVPGAPPSAPGGPRGLSFRSTAHGLVLSLPAALGFDDTRAALRLEIAGSPARFQGTAVRLDLGQGQVSLFDLRRIIHLLKDEGGAEVVGLYCTPEALHRYAEKELKLKIYVTSAPSEATVTPVVSAEEPVTEESRTDIISPPAAEAEEESRGARVLTIHGTVRSGAVVSFGGDVHVFGDVNPGGQIIAGGNVVVLGALKGLAHAGGTRGLDAFILAFDLRPTQLRIGSVIQITPDSGADKAGRNFFPEIAWIANGSVVIEPYRGRLPNQALKEVS